MKIEHTFAITQPEVIRTSFEHPRITIPALSVPQLATQAVLDDLSHAPHLKKLRGIRMNSDHNCIVLLCADKDTGYMAASYLSARQGDVYLGDTINLSELVVKLDEDDEDFTPEEEFLQQGVLPIYSPNVTMEHFFSEQASPYGPGDGRVTIRQGARRNVDSWVGLTSSHPILITPMAISNSFVPMIEAQNNMRSLTIVLLNRPKKKPAIADCYDCYALAEELRFSCAATVVELDTPKPDSEYSCAMLTQGLQQQGLALAPDADPKAVLKQLEAFRTGRGGAGNRNIAAFTRMMGIHYRTDGPAPDLLTQQQAMDFLKLEGGGKPGRRKRKMHCEYDLCGCEQVKAQLHSVVDSMNAERRRRDAGLPAAKHGPVLLFAGAPGTGKTTAAHMLCEWLENELLLETGYNGESGCHQISGAQLKGKYVGQTAPLVHQLFEDHSFLFIDEAYALAEAGQDNDVFAREAMAQLCIELENLPEDHVVVFAGYGGRQNRMRAFLDANPGLASRITTTIQFDAYSPDRELPAIFAQLADAKKLTLADGWRKIAVPYFTRRAAAADYGSGREARRLLESALTAQAHRLAATDCIDRAALCTLTADDLREAVAALEQGFAALNSAKPMRCGL